MSHVSCHEKAKKAYHDPCFNDLWRRRWRNPYVSSMMSVRTEYRVRVFGCKRDARQGSRSDRLHYDVDEPGLSVDSIRVG